ncbi:DUF2075 domain-containing protein [Latilactobacillus graminis]|uniref:Schlafen group 3-like DNA/RNA helicase domain-containing protein n=2 Tax=Latilactobacillus graminis TaxID=60519 RepID=A0AA89I9F3_9LACO|nr:DUF2075 domain-containing protein [Latilactobacillus graminis]KRM24266.1 hypothetical protein FC90_GL000743 [Latilactobacillus graminis DSM 20719]QFP78756.1 DUF2075 domain-containing protein [Latilactobacillus graminis]
MPNAQRQNSALYKLNRPTNQLTAQQQSIQEQVIQFCLANANAKQATFLIQGAAGTGKSVLLSNLFKTLQTLARKTPTSPLYGCQNYLLVNHPEMLKLYKSGVTPSSVLLKKDFQRPTTFINQAAKNQQSVDIVLVDEAHLLLTKPDPYNHFKQNNQLDEIQRHSRITILVFDEQQVLKVKSYWQQQQLTQRINLIPHQTAQLTQQFRIQAHSSIENWIQAFHHQQVLALPHDPHFEFKVFADANDLYQAIRFKNQTSGLARMLATYDFPATLNDGHDHFVETPTFKLRWDRYQPTAKTYWAEREDSIDEVGSVYTIQGFDLNYAGIIIGPSVTYDPQNDCLVIHPEYYEDQAAFAGASHLADPIAAKHRIILNSLYVLMSRARNGLYLYAIDPALQTKLLSL